VLSPVRMAVTIVRYLGLVLVLTYPSSMVSVLYVLPAIVESWAMADVVVHDFIDKSTIAEGTIACLDLEHVVLQLYISSSFSVELGVCSAVGEAANTLLMLTFGSKL
jgi:hypothetical protein